MEVFLFMDYSINFILLTVTDPLTGLQFLGHINLTFINQWKYFPGNDTPHLEIFALKEALIS